MKDWVHNKTNGFLEDLELDWELCEDTAFSILSTIYFKDGWKYKFSGTRNMTFYPDDESEGIVCEFLAVDDDKVKSYSGEKFIAIRKPFANGGDMLFVLPNREYTTNDLLADEEFLRFIVSPDEWQEVSYEKRDLRIPSFDISFESNIAETIKNLGITDVFDPTKADFTPLVGNKKKPIVNEINHGVRIKIDKEGCEAAGYTQIGAVDSVTPIPKIVKFDRPFMFAVLTEGSVPLFTGIINNPTLS
jgi:serpin B